GFCISLALDPEQLALQLARPAGEGLLTLQHHLPAGKALEIPSAHQRTLHSRRRHLQHIRRGHPLARFEPSLQSAAHAGTIVQRDSDVLLPPREPVDAKSEHRPPARSAPLELHQLEPELTETSFDLLPQILIRHEPPLSGTTNKKSGAPAPPLPDGGLLQRCPHCSPLTLKDTKIR